MKEVSQKCRLPTLPGLPRCTCSQALAAGPSHSDKPGGPMIGQSGPALARALLLVKPARDLAFQTKGTSGRSSSGSLESAALTQSLASRLQAKTVLLGSTLWRQTWRLKITPSGRVVPALVVSVRRTSDSDSTGLLIPTAPKLAGWATPIARDWKDTGIRYREGRLQVDILPRQARVFLEREREREEKQQARSD